MSKKILLFCTLYLFSNVAYCQWDLMAGATAGYTFVDAEVHWGGPLDDWSLFNYQIFAQAIQNSEKSFYFGGELGYNRLYYWEQPNYNWGEEATFHLGGFAESQLGAFRVQTGPNFHIWLTDDGGISLGLMSSVLSDIPVNQKIKVPLGIRFDWIASDNQSPVNLGLLFGIKMSL